MRPRLSPVTRTAMSMIERPLPYFARIAYPVLRRLVVEQGRAHIRGYALAFLFMALVAGSQTYSAYLLKPVINGSWMSITATRPTRVSASRPIEVISACSTSRAPFAASVRRDMNSLERRSWK